MYVLVRSKDISCEIPVKNAHQNVVQMFVVNVNYCKKVVPYPIDAYCGQRGYDFL